MNHTKSMFQLSGVHYTLVEPRALAAALGASGSCGSCSKAFARFPSRPLIIRVPFFLLFGFHKGTQNEKG